MRDDVTAANPANDEAAPAEPGRGVALLDAGDGRRLERFGARLLDRPAPGAARPRIAPGLWATADLRFEPERGWTGAVAGEPWTVDVDGLTLELRATPSGGVGLFPEQLANLAWLEARIADCLRTAGAAAILNLFAHTGLLTLAGLRAGASVVHVDASRPAVAWARRNAELSGLADRPVRWLVDDAAGFVAREARRGHRYGGLILDPPSYGRAGSRRWRLLDDLPGLLEGCAAILTPEAFVLLTAHTTGITGDDLGGVVEPALSPGRASPGAEVVPLRLEAPGGAHLDLGWAVRLARRSSAER